MPRALVHGTCAPLGDRETVTQTSAQRLAARRPAGDDGEASAEEAAVPPGQSTPRTSRRPAGPPPNAPLPAALRGVLVGERDPLAQFALICAHLRPELIRAARAAGAGSNADDVVSDVVARMFRRLVDTPPTTLATPHTYNHLRAGLLVAARNAARTRLRDGRRLVLVDGGALQDLAGADPAPSALTSVTDANDLRALREALEALPWRDGQIARLIGVHNLTIREVATRLDLPPSTVHSTWQRIQQQLHDGVRAITDGETCRGAAPYLALLHAHYRALRRDGRAHQLDDLVGPAEADRLARHVYGAGGSDGGCVACRRALKLQRTALQSFAPIPLMPDVWADGAGERVRGAAARLWDTTIGSLTRMAHNLLATMGGGTADPVIGGTVAPLAGTGAKMAAVVAAAVVAATPTVLSPSPRSAVSSPPVARTSAAAQTPASTTPPPTRRTVTQTQARPAARQTRSGGGDTSRTTLSPSARAAASRASAEFTPGP